MKKNIAGFTMVEVLTVLGIIITLIGIGIPAYNSWRNRSEIAKARSAIQQIEMALEMYRTDNGVYPNNSGDLNSDNLLNYLGGYLKIKAEDLNGNILQDPWGRPYLVYVDHDGNPSTGPAEFAYNRSSYYIHSNGPSGSSPNDDIDNYIIQ